MTVYLAFPRDDAALRALVEQHKAQFDERGFGFAYAYSHGAKGVEPCLVLDLPAGVDPSSLVSGLEFSEVQVVEVAAETPIQVVSEPEQQKEGEDDGKQAEEEYL